MQKRVIIIFDMIYDQYRPIPFFSMNNACFTRHLKLQYRFYHSSAITQSQIIMINVYPVLKIKKSLILSFFIVLIGFTWWKLAQNRFQNVSIRFYCLTDLELLFSLFASQKHTLARYFGAQIQSLLSILRQHFSNSRNVSIFLDTFGIASQLWPTKIDEHRTGRNI